jgi:hypothetical protein
MTALPETTPTPRVIDTEARNLAEDRFFTANSKSRPPATDEQKASVARINAALVELAVAIEEETPRSRNKSLALTALEDVSMRANRAIFATGPTA